MQSGATVQEGKGKARSGSELLDVFEVSFPDDIACPCNVRL